MIRPVVFVAVSSLGFLWWLTRPSEHCQSCGHPATHHYEDGQCHGSLSPIFRGRPCPCVGYWSPYDCAPKTALYWLTPTRGDSPVQRIGREQAQPRVRSAA